MYNIFYTLNEWYFNLELRSFLHKKMKITNSDQSKKSYTFVINTKLRERKTRTLGNTRVGIRCLG